MLYPKCDHNHITCMLGSAPVPYSRHSP